MFKILVLLLLYFNFAISQNGPPTVCLNEGACYKGSWYHSIPNGVWFASFQGIRYAQPPIGTLRFKVPQPYHEDEGAIINVSGESKVMCPQFNMNYTLMVGEEDCLFLNVYIPDLVFDDPSVKAPVMVFIHGGGLVGGSGTYADYGPQHFMNKNVIIVTINYRLGPLGFLSMGTEDVPGNAGLRDQVLALEWVQQNIANFGGDPSLVTIFGESAGSWSVASHIISPLSKNLFKRAIMESGSLLDSGCGPITPEHAIDYKDLFSKNLGCSESENVLECLQEKDVHDIVLQLDVLGNGVIIWTVVPDFEFTSEPFLPGNAEDLMSSGQFNKDIEVIAGHNADEGLLFTWGYIQYPSLWEQLQESFDTMAPQQFFAIANVSDITNVDVENAHKLVEYYMGSEENLNPDHFQGLVDMYTDSWFAYGHHKTVDYLMKHGVPVFQYLFAYEGQFSLTSIFGLDGYYGVCHADELIYFWEPILSGIEPSNLGPLTGNDILIREILLSAWINFATYGDPTPPDSKFDWLPQTPDTQHLYWYVSNLEPTMSTTQEIEERWNLWNDLLSYKKA